MILRLSELIEVNFNDFLLRYAFYMVDASETQVSDLFQSYLEVCNDALKQNKNRFPFKQILDAARTNAASRTIEVHIVDDKPKSDIMMTLDADAIRAQSHADCDNCQCDAKWSVSKTYLEDVVNNPDAYIQNPAKIDWDWLYDSS